MKSPEGFSLVELLAVILLVGLLAAAVSISLAAANRNATMEDVLEQVRQHDALGRADARQKGSPVQLVYSMHDSSLWRERRDGQGTMRRGAASDVLPPGYSIAEVRTAQTRGSFGKQTMTLSHRGQSPAYAVRVQGQEGVRKWVVFAGLTGQSLIADNDREVDEFFQVLSRGPDAD